jgi:hypothetical protein
MGEWGIITLSYYPIPPFPHYPIKKGFAFHKLRGDLWLLIGNYLIYKTFF